MKKTPYYLLSLFLVTASVLAACGSKASLTAGRNASTSIGSTPLSPNQVIAEGHDSDWRVLVSCRQDWHPIWEATRGYQDPGRECRPLYSLYDFHHTFDCSYDCIECNYPVLKQIITVL